MQDVGQSEALAKQSVKCKKRAFSCEKYGLEVMSLMQHMES